MLSQRNAPPDGPGKDGKGILRSLPVKPPPAFVSESSMQDQLLRLRRLCRMVAGGAALVVLAAIGAFLFFRTGSGAPSTSDKSEEARPAPREGKLTSSKLGTLKPLPTPGDSPVKGDATVKKSAESKGREPYLETIGALSIVHLYQTYLNIGLLADSMENETYTYTEAVNVMLTVTELLTLVERQLEKMPTKGLTAEDEEALEELRRLTGLLRTQSNALVSYWASREEAHAARYQTAREQSWNSIKEMMGLED